MKNGYDSLNKNELLFRVNLVDTGKNTFAIIFSVSHMLADGFTYYTLYKISIPIKAELPYFHLYY